jgi:hypothetical protein
MILHMKDGIFYGGWCSSVYHACHACDLNYNFCMLHILRCHNGKDSRLEHALPMLVKKLVISSSYYLFQPHSDLITADCIVQLSALSSCLHCPAVCIVQLSALSSCLHFQQSAISLRSLSRNIPFYASVPKKNSLGYLVMSEHPVGPLCETASAITTTPPNLSRNPVLELAGGFLLCIVSKKQTIRNGRL